MEKSDKKKRVKKNKGKVRSIKTATQKEDDEIEGLKSKYEGFNPREVNSFEEMPLSRKTQEGLKACDYKIPTEIQKASIINALQGKDVLGAAVTGSGKTLAFLVPILEILYVRKWTRLDGVGAVVITPTRELAYQIFETMKKIGVNHEFSAGLIIGGKNLKFERKRMDQCNIIICTPGRLLQHMDETPLFNCDSMQILILDEADRCLDMGFEATMNAIIENFPKERQTLLFSATQTRCVKDLARLSLVDPTYVAPHEQQATVKVTPDNLSHSYVVCELKDKIAMLWSFIKHHNRSKIIVFLTCCKQVKYISEIFTKLRPGIALLALYGTIRQDRRMEVYNEFMRKTTVVLLATDIASRGLDFPSVNWVLQLDCPEDAVAYIHRAGRTARFNASGENLLVVTPSEEQGMLEELKTRNITVEKITIDDKFMFAPHAKMQIHLTKSQELKESAKRAFTHYIKSIVLMKKKCIFNVNTLDFDGFARSLGLVTTPRVRFLERQRKQMGQTKVSTCPKEEDYGINDSDDEEWKDMIVGAKPIEISNGETLPLPKPKVISKASAAKMVLKRKIAVNTKITFDDNAEEDVMEEFDQQKAKERLQQEDKNDTSRYRDILKTKKKVRKEKQKKRQEEEQEQDDFGSSDEEPDLSWVPDPDQIYGTQEASNSEPEEPMKKKSKKKHKNLSLNDAESLAMQLMGQ